MHRLYVEASSGRFLAVSQNSTFAQGAKTYIIDNMDLEVVEEVVFT